MSRESPFHRLSQQLSAVNTVCLFLDKMIVFFSCGNSVILLHSSVVFLFWMFTVYSCDSNFSDFCARNTIFNSNISKCC